MKINKIVIKNEEINRETEKRKKEFERSFFSLSFIIKISYIYKGLH